MCALWLSTQGDARFRNTAEWFITNHSEFGELWVRGVALWCLGALMPMRSRLPTRQVAYSFLQPVQRDHSYEPKSEWIDWVHAALCLCLCSLPLPLPPLSGHVKSRLILVPAPCGVRSVLTLSGNRFEGPIPTAIWTYNQLKCVHCCVHSVDVFVTSTFRSVPQRNSPGQ